MAKRAPKKAPEKFVIIYDDSDYIPGEAPFASLQGAHNHAVAALTGNDYDDQPDESAVIYKLVPVRKLSKPTEPTIEEL
jgi:hypothetical protein